MDSNRGLHAGIPGLPAVDSSLTNFPTQPASRCAGELPEAVGLTAFPRELRQLASLEVLSLSNCFRLPCLPPAVASLTRSASCLTPLCSRRPHCAAL